MELLSAAWCERWTVAAASLTPPQVAPFSVEEILEGPSGSRRVRLSFDGEAFALAPATGSEAEATATFTLAEETAAGLASGALSPAEALARGLVKVAGDLGALVASQEALAAVAALVTDS